MATGQASFTRRGSSKGASKSSIASAFSARVFTFDYPAEDGKSYRHTIKLEAPKTLDELIDAARVELARGNYYEIPGKS